MPLKLKVGFVPEHFSTPIQFSQQHKYYESEGLEIELIPYLAGSGHLIQSLGDGSIDIAIGLTEAFIRGIANGNESYNIIGTYVDSPLCWSISTGYNRDDITEIEQLNGKKIGVSRIGSGSYVMSFVLALEKKFSKPFFQDYPICSTFKNLRDSVNLKGVEGDATKNSDAFMWEHFTSKKYYDNKEIKKIGEIYTPWPSWVITARSQLVAEHGKEIAGFLRSIEKGIKYFNDHQEEAIEYIYNNLDYSEEDAREWIKTVKFAKDVNAVDSDKVVNKTFKVLRTAGVLNESDSDEVIEQRLKKFVA